MTLKRKLGSDIKNIDIEKKAINIPIIDRKKKPLTKNELMTEYKALEKKHEELQVENEKLREKLAVLEKGGTRSIATVEQECQTKPDSKYVEISCTECIFIASCEDELNYHMGDEHNKDFISYFETDYPCSVCDRWCRSQKDLNHHMKIYHGKRVKFCSIECKPCDRIIGKDENERERKDSMDMSIEVQESKHTYTCSICKENFKSKSELMKHRKKEHLEKVKICWNFESSKCQFAEDMCWFRHCNSEMHQDQYNCKFCGEVFRSRNDLQTHLKTKHSKTVPYCNNVVCWYGPEKCWFRHSENE